MKWASGGRLGTEHASWVRMQKKAEPRGCATRSEGDRGFVALP